MNKIPNRQAICEVLMKHAETDQDIVVLCSDSRGSASLTPFANAYPEQFVEMGIAEQDLVSVSAGLAKCGKKAFAASPACFLSTRSYEQVKIDCAYSNTNVKLIGISGGVSYGALGMSHHSAQDIAAMAAIPNMRVYLPSDRFQTAKLVEALLTDENRLISGWEEMPLRIFTAKKIPRLRWIRRRFSWKAPMFTGSLRRDGPPGVRCSCHAERRGNQRRTARYVLCETVGQRGPGRSCKEGKSCHFDRRARSIRRSWIDGEPGGRCGMPAQSRSYVSAGCAGDHGNFQRSL